MAIGKALLIVAAFTAWAITITAVAAIAWTKGGLPNMDTNSSLVLIAGIAGIPGIVTAWGVFYGIWATNSRERAKAESERKKEERVEQVRVEAEKVAAELVRNANIAAEKLEATRAAATATAESVENIHKAVNSERTEMLKHVEELKNEITRLLVDKASKEAAAAAAAAAAAPGAPPPRDAAVTAAAAATTTTLTTPAPTAVGEELHLKVQRIDRPKEGGA